MIFFPCHPQGADICRLWRIHQALYCFDYHLEESREIKDMLLECFINVNYIKKEEASGFSSWCVCELLLKKLISVLTAPSRLCCVQGPFFAAVCGVLRASLIVEHGLSWGTARAVFLDQGANPCSLRW